jgi:hypothetical protein
MTLTESANQFSGPTPTPTLTLGGTGTHFLVVRSRLGPNVVSILSGIGGHVRVTAHGPDHVLRLERGPPRDDWARFRVVRADEEEQQRGEGEENDEAKGVLLQCVENGAFVGYDGQYPRGEGEGGEIASGSTRNSHRVTIKTFYRFKFIFYLLLIINT